MNRSIAVALIAAATAVVVCAACSRVVWLGSHGSGRYEAAPDSTALPVIDGRGMSRPALEARLADYEVVARLHTSLPSGDRREEAIAQALAKAQPVAQQAGAHALLYLDDSAVMGVIFRDARYAGPPGALVMYLLRRR